MIRLLAVCLAIGVVSGCSDEPEIVVVEPVEEDEVDYSEAKSAPLSWDADGDGLLNEKEYMSLSNSAWGIWDADRDGSLSMEEFSAGWTDLGFSDATGAFGTLDRDEDGIVVQAEFLSTKHWEEWDVDDSGVLEAGEFSYY